MKKTECDYAEIVKEQPQPPLAKNCHGIMF